MHTRVIFELNKCAVHMCIKLPIPYVSMYSYNHSIYRIYLPYSLPRTHVANTKISYYPSPTNNNVISYKLDRFYFIVTMLLLLLMCTCF